LARKILLADDSVTAQNMGRKILSDAGYEVIAVNNGSAALKKIAELKPDLVILDVYMPGYSGLEVCQRLKESQETARIPVLLSVGKLEPFKPDEAQRVRADAFIVKPFEASELLSALSKLEDKVVPRSEPSKPGRFARAMAVVEESSRSSAKEAANDENNGWKNRIAFPHEKAVEPEEKVADEASFYNPMNRDLRTVVETPAEKTEREAAPVAIKAQAANPQEPAAAIPFEDVTPQEVAAIAAAVAHMKGADTPVETYPDQMPGAVSAERLSAATVSIEAPPVAAPPVAAKPAEAEPIAAAELGSKSQEKEKDSEAPATIAAGTDSEVEIIKSDARWSAMPVALDNVEASRSLEQEMREAYAAYSAYENEPASEAASVVTAPQAEPVSSEHCPPPVSLPEPALTEAPVAAIATPDPEPISHAGPWDAPQVPAAESQTSQPQEAAMVANSPVLDEKPEPMQAESAPSDSLTETASAADFSHLNQVSVPDAAVGPSPMVVEQPTPEPGVADAALVAAARYEMPSSPQAPGSADSTSVVIEGFSQAIPEMPAAMSAQSEAERQVEPSAYSQPESEVVKSSAAAWATWRQIRDTSDTTAGAEDKSLNNDALPPPDSAAMAVAAGAEQIPQPVSPVENDTPADVASIVDSVLADLRPRLMEEISRKMAQKK
jgi:CheY-like chemotaxis protein